MKKNVIDERLIIVSSFISFLGNGMQFIALSWLVYKITNSSSSVGILVLCETIPGIFISPIAGALVDRYNKKFLIVSMDIIRGLVIIPLIILISNHHIDVIYIYIIAILITICSNFFYPALSGMIKETIPEERISILMSKNGSSLQLGMIIGSGLAGVFLSKYGLVYVLFFNFLSYIISAIILLFISKHEYKNRKRSVDFHLFSDIKEGIKILLLEKQLIFLIIIGLSTGCATNVINISLSSFTSDTLKLSVKEYGILDASFAVGSLLAGISLAYFKILNKELFLLRIGIIFMLIGSLLISILSSYYFSLVGLFVIGIGSMLEAIHRRSLVIKKTPSEYIGRIESLNWVIYSTMSPIFAIILSIISDKTTSIFSFYALSVFLLLIYLYSNKIKNFEAHK
ncbi:MFS transporter [Staphylococcus pseudintermedius]|nr:MFS transporter [Staphylococcus pseudintermedius]